MKITSTKSYSGVALGGLGTGSIELWPDGTFREWLIFNNKRWTMHGNNEFHADERDLVFALRISSDSIEDPPVRLLRTGFWVENDQDLTYGGCGPHALLHPYHMPWLRPVNAIEYDGKPPIALLKFSDEAFDRYGVEASMEAFSPLIMGDVTRSSIPVAILKFNFKNNGNNAIDLSLMGIMRNPHNIGNDITISSKPISGPNYGGVSFSGLNIPNNHGMHGGELALIYRGGIDSGASYILDRGNREYFITKLRSIFVDFRNDGLLEGSLTSEVTGLDLYSALTKRIRLEPGRSTSIITVLSWFYPNHLDHGKRVGHYYENMFGNVEEVIKYVVNNYESLYDDTRKFVDTMYGANYPEWIIDLAVSQITTIAKSSWFTKDGFFGIWEGGPGCCGLSTLDVALWGLVGVNLLFPDLAKRIVNQFSHYILTPNVSPQYEIFTLAFPSNMAKYRSLLLNDPSIQHDERKLRETIRSIAREGVDPSGRIPHAFRGTSEIDTYDRSDLMPEFVLLSLLSYRWTGDKEYLTGIWSSLKLTIDAMLRQHDDAKTKLPYHTLPSGYEGYSSVANLLGRNLRETELLRQLLSGPMFLPTTVNTFDTMNLFGIAIFTSDLWISAIRAMMDAANDIEKKYGEQLSKIYEEARHNMIKLLWNGEYFDLWHDPLTGLRDNACMTAGLTGEWYLNQLLGLGYNIDRSMVLSMLKSIYRNNYKVNEGLLNATYPNKPRPSLNGELKYFNGLEIPYKISGQMDTPWTGIEIPIADHLIWEGMIDEGIEILKNIHARYMHYGIYWNHIECDGHYFRPLASLDIPNALAGFRYIGSSGLLIVGPRLGQPFKGPVLGPAFLGMLEYSEDALRLKGIIGNILVRALSVPSNLKIVSVSFNGINIPISSMGSMVSLGNTVSLGSNDVLEIIVTAN